VQILEGLINQDYNMYRIYAQGEWGALTNLIYTNWQPVAHFPDLGKPKIIYGLDFGYNDPMALVRIMIKGFDTYEEQVIYQSGLTVKQLINQMDILIPSTHKRVPIYCDSAVPDKIIELRQAGYNAKPAQKSVLDGIDFVKRFSCHVLDSGTELLKELRSYSWKTDKNKQVLDEPVDYQNHLQDARRYALYTHLKGSNRFNIRFIDA
jgi:phage terminase large subunit